MKKFIILLALLMVAMVNSLKADTAVLTLTGASPTNMVFKGPARLLSLSISSTAGTNGNLFFYDSPFLTNTVSVGAYTNYTKAVATTNIVYTNVFGVVSTNSYSIIRYTTNTATGGQQVRELIYSGLSVSNSTSVITFDVGKFLQGGLLVTNITTLGGLPGSVTINAEYEKLY